MASTRELRLRVRSIKNLSQVTHALETVSANYVHKTVQATKTTQPYAEKAWKVLIHMARQPGYNHLHPLLRESDDIRRILVVLVSGDRGLAGAYHINIVRAALQHFASSRAPVAYIAVGRKGRDLLLRRHQEVVADFSQLPTPPSFGDVAAIGQLAVDDYARGMYDQVWIAYTEYVNRAVQRMVIRMLLPLKVFYAEAGQPVPDRFNVTHHRVNAPFTYEPGQTEVLNEVIPRFCALQIYQSILSAQASEHTARMVAMHNATQSANELIGALQLEYNKLRQQNITNEMLDISGGAEAFRDTV